MYSKLNNTNSIPKELKLSRQWLPHRKKAPIDPRTHTKAKWQKPETWRRFDQAVSYAKQNNCDGVGFVVTENDPYCFIDIDNCRNKRTGELGFGVKEIIDELDSYAEASPSGKGVHAVVRATKPGNGTSTADTLWGGKLEIYDRNKFLTVTGDVIWDAPIRDAQDAIDSLYGDYFGEDGSKVGESAKTPSGSFSGDVRERIEKARNHSKTGKLFRKLFDHGNTSDYPSRSEADQALCGMLAYWFGCDSEQIKSQFRRSALAQGKYAEKGRHAEKYLDKMVSKAVQSCTRTYDPDHGDRVRAKVRDHVGVLREAVRESNLSDRKKLVIGVVLDAAGWWGKYKNGKARFNIDQIFIAKQTGIPQPTVSRLLQSLIDEGWLDRKGKYRPPKGGKPGKSYTYELPKEAPIKVNTSYVHRVPSVMDNVGLTSIHPEQSDSDYQVIDFPFIDASGEVYSPTFKQASPEKPCIHSYGGHVYPGGSGCYLCDADHPYRAKPDDKSSSHRKAA